MHKSREERSFLEVVDQRVHRELPTGAREDPLGEDCIIHRSGAGVITNNYQKDLKRRL
jgi:hypothetical protein